MKRNGIVLAALGMLILCMLAYSVISRSYTPPAPSSNLAAAPAMPLASPDGDSNTQPLGTEDKASPTDLPEPTPAPADTPQQPNESLSMEPLLKKLIGGGAAPVPGDLVTKPEKCVFVGPPYRLAYLQEENLLLLINFAGVHAFDIASGGQIWHRYLDATPGQFGATFGHRQVLGWSDQEVFLLDAATGRKIWARYDDRCGPMESARLSPDESQVAVVCKQGCILYAVADRSLHVLPRPANTGMYGWLRSNKTLFFVQRKGPNDYAIEKLLLMDADSGAVTTGFNPGPSRVEMPPMLSTLGQFALTADDEKNVRALTIRDARTGKVLREFKGISGLSTYLFWLQDARRLLFLKVGIKQACVVDTETGIVQFSLSREGHRFCTYEPFEDASGNAWIFSQDEADNWYVWPLAPDGAPRKVLDGTRIASGTLRLHPSDPCYVLLSRMDKGQLTHTAYALEDMRKIAEWRIRDQDLGWWYGPNVNKAMTHYVHFHSEIKYSPETRNEWSRPQNVAFSVNVQDKETPVYTGKGRPIAVSPDAKYLAVQTDDTTSCLYDIETNEIVGRFSVPVRENIHVNMNAAFSDDGRRAVVNTTESIEVMDLTQSYPRWPMITGEDKRLRWGRPCLSPDGTRVLCGGYGGYAGLFDADTGVLLHSFEEAERFANPYGQGVGFWGRLAITAQDWVGTITDKFKPGGEVEVAFTDGGARVITRAVGQIIRVWDADSGTLLHTIHTGLPEQRNRDGYIDNRIVLSATGRFAFCFNANNFGIASLWSLADGTLQRRYQLPERASAWAQAALTDDGMAVYITIGEDLYRWPGAPARENQEKDDVNAH